MTFLDLGREVRDLLDGSCPPALDDLDLAHELAFMRATREVEPPPPMSVDLICRLGAGAQSRVN
jgi:hypothetical protein